MIVLDSSFLVAYHNERDVHHVKACRVMEEFLAGRWGKGLLLEYVFLEVTTVLLVRRDLAVAVHAGRVLLDASELEFVPGLDLFLETMQAFATQTGTRLSFADAAIAIAARSRANGLVATFDEEFRKINGLRLIPDSI